MGRTVDFSCRMLYDKNGFARTQSRIIESCPRMLCGGYRKGRKTARCLPKRNGVGNPTRTALWAQECTEAALAAGTKVRHWEKPPEKVGCRRGAIGSTARGRRIARRRTGTQRRFFVVAESRSGRGPSRQGRIGLFCGKCAGCPVREAGFFAGGASSARSQVGTAQAVRFP